MTPKEKALELIDKCMRYHRNGIYNVVHKDIAKQYAMIVVEEILDNDNLYTELFIYYSQVKQEIKLL